MSEFVIPSTPQATVAVAGTDARFPVRRIFCVGRNYVAHVREMGNDERDPPFFFTKPADALVDSGTVMPFPVATDDLHHEAELVVAIHKGGANISVDDALDHVWGYAAGVDLTRRDLQAAAKKAARPWDMSKGFDQSAPCGPLHPASEVGHLSQGHIRLNVNGEVRQDGDLNEMIWNVPETVSYLSGLLTLAPGDLIYTGTPAGVSALTPGDTCTVEIAGLTPLVFTISK